MANRRMGGMGGNRNRPFSQQQPFQGGVSPWQGNQNPMNQGGGLLSLTSNPNQLALALSNLLQPQQMNPPSLLSLNTSPGFSNQDRDFNRFGNRGRDFRRHEPYSKNRNGGGNWRNDNNKRKGGKRSPSRDQKKKDDKKKDEKKDVIDLASEEGAEENGEKNAENETGEDGKKSKEGEYHGVPVKYLNCFVCNKEMWDGESMLKHVKGRAHRQMLDALGESTHITVNILRENMRLIEEKKVIELDRMQRVSKKYSKFPDISSHCNMCDLKFLGKIVAHRKTEGHQRLKRYLHPNCRICDKEFPSRMEWVDHRLTPDHLRKLNESLENKKGGPDGDVLIVDEEPDLDMETLLEEQLHMEEESPILELTDDLSGLQNLIPAYKSHRAVSTQSLIPFTGFRCELCNRSFEDEELAQKHLKTRRHYYAFIDAAKSKYKKMMAKKARDEKENAEKAENETLDEDGTDKNDETQESQNEEEGDREMYDPEEACNENEEEEGGGVEGGEGGEDAEIGGEAEEEEGMDTNEGDPSVITAEEAELIEEEDEEIVEVVPETKAKPPAASTPTPQQRQTRTAATAANPVKSTAGPKSKKLATTPASKASEQGQKAKATTGSTFRIPKLTSADKSKK